MTPDQDQRRKKGTGWRVKVVSKHDVGHGKAGAS